MKSNYQVEASFRDPSGFMFVHEGVLYRQVNELYRQNYDMLMSSGLYHALTTQGMMVPHEEVADLSLAQTAEVYKILRPQVIDFISYPYEWCFSQLKDAALLTLHIQRLALEHGMSLKDASNYNIQFFEGRPVFIDTLSFERYAEGKPWIAYRQFCEHFLSPLLMMQYVDPRLNRILSSYVDGIPLEIVSNLLPFKTKLNLRLLTHVHLHAKSKRHFSDKKVEKKDMRFGRRSMLGFLDTLQGTVKAISWQPEKTEWGEYYSDTNYSQVAHSHKKELVARFFQISRPDMVWDIGANDGTFSRIASNQGIFTIASDYDPASVEKNYRKVRAEKEVSILPLILDITNPSPNIGWDGTERKSFFSRGPCDTLMALALVHHLAISNNIPLERIARFFGRLCRHLIIEWVPKEDSMVQRLLWNREDIFKKYSQTEFESAFGKYFKVVEAEVIKESMRTLYLMKCNNSLQ